MVHLKDGFEDIFVGKSKRFATLKTCSQARHPFPRSRFILRRLKKKTPFCLSRSSKGRVGNWPKISMVEMKSSCLCSLFGVFADGDVWSYYPQKFLSFYSKTIQFISRIAHVSKNIATKYINWIKERSLCNMIFHNKYLKKT